jgi:hypothetical protein
MFLLKTLLNAIRFFGSSRKSLLQWLEILKLQLQRDCQSLSCLKYLEADLEMSAAPLGCDFPDAGTKLNLQELSSCISENVSSETLLSPEMSGVLKRSYQLYARLYPDLLPKEQPVDGSLWLPTQSQDSATSTLPTTVDSEDQLASVLSSTRIESIEQPSTSKVISNPLLSGKRRGTFDPFTASQPKRMKTITPSSIFSSK